MQRQPTERKKKLQKIWLIRDLLKLFAEYIMQNAGLDESRQNQDFQEKYQ